MPIRFQTSPGNAAPTGLGLMYMMAGVGAPTDGVTGAGTAPKGTFYLNTTNGQFYVNQGSLAVPEWHIVIQG